jgi:hypothetical protein
MCEVRTKPCEVNIYVMKLAFCVQNCVKFVPNCVKLIFLPNKINDLQALNLRNARARVRACARLHKRALKSSAKFDKEPMKNQFSVDKFCEKKNPLAIENGGWGIFGERFRWENRNKES